MESDIPMETVEDVSMEPGQAATDCLSIPLILRNLFQHLSTWDLLQLSLVNKLWSYEARRLLRNRGTVTATINKNKKCQDLIAFASDLRRTKEITKVLPSTGLTIHLGGLDCNHGYGRQQSSTSELDQACKFVLDQLTLKYFALKFHLEWTDDLRACHGYLLMKKTLEKCSPFLEEFLLELPKERGDSMQKLIQSCCSTFSHLRILKVKVPTDNFLDGYTRLIRSLVSHSPNLEVLYTSNRVNLRGNLLEGSSAVHVTDFPFSPFRNDIPKGVIGRLRLTFMELDHCNLWRNFHVNRFNNITFGLLEASRTTLRSMRIDAIFLAPLTTYGISLENVRSLVINLEHRDLEAIQPRALRLVKCFDFTRIFPNLKAVRLYCSSDFNYYLRGIHTMIDQGNAAFREPLPGRAVNMKNLSVNSAKDITDSTGQFLAEMFPNVESLSIGGTEIPFGRIWEYWRNLETLCVDYIYDGLVVKNLDSVFCGIFPEEVAVLREEDEEYLKAVNIVPVMPSITCLEKLKSLNLYFEELFMPMESVGNPTFLFSKVTGLIAFQRCPDLDVTLKTKDTRTLSHLRAYATILPEDDHSCSA